MFSGTVKWMARILKRDGPTFLIDNVLWNDIRVGQSIAHDGVCLTVTALYDSKSHLMEHTDAWTIDSYDVFVMEETFAKTNLWEKKLWDYMNVERSLNPWENLDGHLVSGHVDMTVILEDVKIQEDGSYAMYFAYDPVYMPLVVTKGSICINGVSLTVVKSRKAKSKYWETKGKEHLKWMAIFSVALIPYTLSQTNLARCQVGDYVNVEFDMIGKYILQYGKIGSGRENLQDVIKKMMSFGS